MWINQDHGNLEVVDYVKQELTCTMFSSEVDNVELTMEYLVSAFGRLLNNLAERRLIQEVDLKKIVENCTLELEDEYKLTKD